MINESASSDFLNLVVEKLAERLMPELLERISGKLPITKDETLDIKEAAASLKVSKELLYQMCTEGAIPHMRLGSEGARKKRVLFSSVSLANWKREQEMQNYKQRHESINP